MSRYTLNKYASRLMAVLLMLSLLLSFAPAAAAAESGTCGDGLTWSLSAGTLTITGSGAMTNFPESTMAPWYHLREEILRLELPQGLTSIGDLAFYDCPNLTAVTIPDSVTTIGIYAFARCAGMEILNLGSGITRIGEAAFEGCTSVGAIRLPAALTYMGMKAFYRCETITAITVPESVTYMGVSTFAYCKNLVTADVRARVTQIPEYMFYGCERLTSVTLPDNLSDASDFAFSGCDSLNTVRYGGTAMTPEELQEMVNANVPEFENQGSVSDEEAPGSASSGYVQENEDGSLTWESTTVTQEEDVTVSTKVETTENQEEQQSSITVDVTITDEAGWDQAKDTVQDAINNFGDMVESQENNKGSVNVNIYVSGTDTIDREFVDSLTDRDATITITTEDGSSWRVDTSELVEPSQEYNFSFTISAGTEELCRELETETCFVVRFHASAVINAEVLMNLGSSLALQDATLILRGEEGLERVQSTVVDREGCAHFYLGAVDSQREYYIAMNLPDVQDAIIPAELASDYGNPDYAEPIQYEITGVKSSWGMTFSQVTWIMAGVLVGCVIIVGVVMYMLNKRKLRMGYVPDLDDEDLDADK